MNIVDRVKRLLLAPDPEWSVIAAESATLGGLITGYVLPVAALGAIGSLVGSVLWLGGFGLGVVVRVAVIGVVTSIVGVVVLSGIVRLKRASGVPKFTSEPPLVLKKFA